MLELLAPAGSMEALQAAVQNGADAVYLGAGAFNARMGARNFTMDELSEAATYCHVRGVRLHLTVNTLVTDRELPQAAQLLSDAARCGVDAFIVQDLGMVSLCQQAAPGVALHASTQMSLHNLEGVRQAQRLGFSRAIVAREISQENLRAVCRSSPIEIEVFAHGALCMCHSGQCYFSGMVGQRSGNRGRCAQPCRLPYGFGRFEHKYPLSLKDNCLLGRVQELDALGVRSLKLEGRMKRPEYVAIVTDLYRRAIDGAPITRRDLTRLEEIFSRGFTEDYYRGTPGPQMFGTRPEGEHPPAALLSEARASYEGAERQRTQVRFYVLVRKNEPAMLAVEDPEGHICKTSGPVPEEAVSRPLTVEDLTARLAKTGGTPYHASGSRVHLDPGLTLSAAAVNAMRRTVLNELTALRGRVPAPAPGSYTAPPRAAGHTGAPLLTVRIQHAEQLTPALRQAAPTVLYVPLAELDAHPAVFADLPAETRLCAVLPRVIFDREVPSVLAMLGRVFDRGVREVLLGNLGHLELARSQGFAIRGDFGLNAFNSRAMWLLQRLELRSATASFELSLPQIRDLAKPLDTELIAYGRLPLMLTENCIIKNRNGSCGCDRPQRLIDRKGEEFYVIRDPGTCRNEILNGKKLYLLDRRGSLSNLGLWALRLQFTTEPPAQVDTVLRDYQQGAAFEPGGCTRGLYLRGVE